MKRFLYAATGTVILLFAGFIYAWSILAAPIAAEFPDWSATALSMTFTICISCFCLGALAAGLLSRRYSPRVSLLLSAVMFLSGFLFSSRAETCATLYLGYGVLCGLASGFAYNTVISMVTRWFPKNQGLISGVLLMGFGSSSLLISSLFTALAENGLGWRQFFTAAGPVMAIVLLLGALMLHPVSEVVGGTSAAESASAVPPEQMLKKSGFWLFFVWAVLLSASGLAVISHAQPIAVWTNPALDAGTLSLLVGIISVCNGLGRIAAGALCDHFGTKPVLLVITSGFLAAAILLAVSCKTNSITLLTVTFLLLGLSYGGVPTMGAAYTKAAFGEKYYGVNFSLMNLNLLIASVGGAAAGLLYDKSGSFYSLCVLMAGCALFAGFTAGFMHHERK